MIKEISYTGLTTTPDDYHADEGTLSYAQDLISQHESLVNPPLPEQTLLLPSNSKLLYVHKQPNYTNNIYYTTGKLFYTTSNDTNKIRLQIEQINNRLVTISNRLAQDTIDIADLNARKEAYIAAGGHEYDKAYQVILIQIGNLESEISSLTSEMNNNTNSLRLLQQQLDIIERGSSQNHDLTTISEEPIQVTSIGTTLVIITSTGIRYAIFRDGNYTILPQSLPSLNPICALRGQYVSTIYKTPIHLSNDNQQLVYNITVGSSKKRVWGDNTSKTPQTINLITDNFTAGYYKLIIEPKTLRLIKMTVEINMVYNDGEEQPTLYNIAYTEKTGTFKELYFQLTPRSTGAFLYLQIKAQWDNAASSDDVTFILQRSETPIQTLIAEDDTYKSYTSLKASIPYFIEQQCLKYKKFMHPFFVRFAYRMYDGRYVCQSAPCLMIPNTGSVPYIRPLDNIEKKSDYYSINFATSAFVADLQAQINTDANIDNWNDIITDVVIAISEPIYEYKDIEDINVLRNEMYLTQYSLNNSFYSYGHITNEDPSNDHSKLTNEDLESEYGAARTSPYSIHMPIKDSLVKLIEESSNFYIIKKIPFEDLCGNNKYNTLTTIDLSDESISNLSSHELLPDDTTSLNEYTPKTAYSYNARLHIANYQEKIFKGYPANNTDQYLNEYDLSTDSRPSVTEYIEIEIHEKENTYTVCETSTSNNQSGIRWYYYPHISAKKVTIYKQIGSQWKKTVLQLKSHPFLNGSYWFNNYNEAAMTNCDAPTIHSSSTTIQKSNYLKVSEPYNPFHFTNLRTYIFDSDILALSAAITPLSTGQAGDFDLYVFTEQDGVWSLKINSEGGYSKQIPVTRDTLTNPKSVTQIDSSVLFATTRGLIELHGSQSTCISEPLDREESISLNDMPLLGAGMLTHLTQLGFTASYAATDTAHKNPILSNIQALDFRTYVQDSQILYDYRNQRIVVFKPNTAYCYSYNLRSKTWTLLSNPYSYKVNSYPDSLVVNSSNVLLNISGDSRLNNSDQQPAFLLTRPFSLDDPNNFKIIDQIRQNGTAESVSESHISQILWGSNDLISWHFISSSITGRISGQTGTPYRFFRLAIATTMTPLETLDSFSVSYRTKENNDKLF